MKMLKQLARLYGIHLAAILAVWLGMYFPGLDLLFCGIYILFILMEGKDSVSGGLAGLKIVSIAVLWQLPGLVLALLVITKIYFSAIYVLELWVTPLLPVISLIPIVAAATKIAYYKLFYGAVLSCILIYFLPLLTKRWWFKR